MNLAPGELVLVVVAVGLLAVPVWACVSALRHSPGEFDSIGQRREVWFVLLLVTTLLCAPMGFFLAVYYLVAVRPQLSRA